VSDVKEHITKHTSFH